MLPIISNKATEARCKVSKVSKGSKYNNSENFALPNMTHDIQTVKESVRASKLERC